MNIRGIQFGPNNYIELLPKELEVLWNYEPDLGDKDTKKWEYDIAFVERPLDRDEIDFLKGHVRAYSLFVIEGYQNEKGMGDLLAHRMGQVLKAEDLQEFLQKDLRDYYGGSYGEKFRPHGLTVSTNFHGDVSWNGFSETVFDGEFGQEMSQMAFYRYNIPIEQLMDVLDKAIDAGCTVAWGGDVSGDFTRTGLAMLPDSVQPSQQLRQEQWNDWRFTYDHVMLIYGKALDEQGKPYYLVKNSWGKTGQYKGIWYMSRDYIALNTTYLFLNRHALPKRLLSTLF